MSKLSIQHLGLDAEIHEKTNVMTPFNSMIYVVLPLFFICIIFVNLWWIKVFSAFMVLVVVIIWVSIYIAHSIKNPELLQSETYRIEQHKIEAGMLMDKDENTAQPEILTTNIIPLLDTKNSEDIKE